MKTFCFIITILKEFTCGVWVRRMGILVRDVCIMTVTCTWLIIGTIFFHRTHTFIDIIWLMYFLSFIWFSLLDFMTLLPHVTSINFLILPRKLDLSLEITFFYIFINFLSWCLQLLNIYSINNLSPIFALWAKIKWSVWKIYFIMDARGAKHIFKS
jgi:hypothetical protein